MINLPFPEWLFASGIAAISASLLLHMVIPIEELASTGLMIMGLFGGTIFPLVMGYASDSMGSQIGAVAVMLVGVVYLVFLGTKVKK